MGDHARGLGVRQRDWQLASFYHVYADGEWEAAAQEYSSALAVSHFPGERFAGLVGNVANCRRVKQFLPLKSVIAQAEAGFEQVTLRALHEWAKSQAPDAVILYAHTKGAAFSAGDERARRWRHAMVHETVMTWEAAEHYLGHYDVVGAGWQEAPNCHFFGNFWWATAGYLATLPPVKNENRYQAETWLGSGNPRVKDLCPDFEQKYGLAWNFYYSTFGMGFDCDLPDCFLTR